MSLIAHWPLDGSLKDITNNGYDLVAETGTSALVVDTEGKIGSCYSNTLLNNTSRLTSLKKFKFKDTCSMFCWINVGQISALNTANGVGGQHEYSTESGMGLNIAGCETFGSSNPNEFKISVNTGYVEGGRTYHTFQNNTVMETNKWYHIGFTFNNNTKEIKFYLNGLLDGVSKIDSSLNMKFVEQEFSLFSWSISHNPAAAYRPIQKINSFRVYNEECSSKLAYEIYKTKLAHYTFNTRTEPTVNLIPNGSFGEGIKQSLYAECIGGTTEIVLDRTAPTSMYALKHIASANDSYTHPYTTNLGTASAGQTWTASVWIKGTTGGEEVEFLILFLNSSGKYEELSIKRFTITNQWERYEITGTAVSANIVGISARLDNNVAGQIIYYNGWQLENKAKATPFVDGSRGALSIKDDGDFSNHAIFTSGNTTAHPQWTSDSKVGLGCYDFNGTTNFIPIGNKCKPPTEITVSLWAYKSNWSDARNEKIISCTQTGGYKFEKSSANIIGFALYANGAYRNPAEINCSTLSSGWHHFTGTFDGQYSKFYVDGQFVSMDDAGTISTIKYNASNGVFIGAESGADAITPAGDYWLGRVDDVRVYATCLNDKDIFSLFNDRLSIDDKGNIFSLGTSGRTNTSILDYNFMKTGLWPLGEGWSSNGEDTENCIIVKSNPWGDEDYVLGTLQNDPASGADGGFNSTYIPIDYNKTYRMSIWIRKEKSSDGKMYFGLYAYDKSGVNVGVYPREASTTLDTNPYFWAGNAAEIPEINNEWALFVAHINPNGRILDMTNPATGIYNTKGQKVRSIRDFRFGDTVASLRIRAYMYYSTSTPERQYFYRPRIDLCDGSEPTIEDLIKCREHDVVYNAPAIPTISDKGVLVGDRVSGRRIRYIRDYLAGSNKNNYCHWVEIKAYLKNGLNVATGKLAYSPSGGSNMINITNNETATTDYAGNFDSTPELIPHYVEIDLGTQYDVEQIAIWHYYADNRIYNKNKTQVSSDGINWYTIFDSEVSGRYVETSAGNIITLSGSDKVSLCDTTPVIAGISNLEQKSFKGELWTKIFDHKNKGGTLPFTSQAEAEATNISNPNADKYSLLNKAFIIKDQYKNGYEMMLEYPLEKPGMYNHWRQGNSPLQNILNYIPLKIDWTQNFWGGLAPSTSGGSLVDGSPGDATWYYAIGAYTEYLGGSPGPDFTTQQVKLWLKTEKNKFQYNRHITL